MKKVYLVLALCFISSVLLFASLAEGAKTVTSAGTEEALSTTSVLARWVFIQADCDNTNNILLGLDNDLSDTATELDACESIILSNAPNAIDLSGIWLDADTSGEGVHYRYATYP